MCVFVCETVSTTPTPTVAPTTTSTTSGTSNYSTERADNWCVIDRRDSVGPHGAAPSFRVIPWNEQSCEGTMTSLWPPCIADADIIFSSCGFFYLSSSSSSSSFSSSLFSSPNLSGRTLDVYHTSTHSVALVQIYRMRSETCCARLAEKSPKIAIWALSHKFAGLCFSN